MAGRRGTRSRGSGSRATRPRCARPEPSDDRRHRNLPSPGARRAARRLAPTARPPAGRPPVRSGLAHRRNPVLVTLGDVRSRVRGESLLRDPLALFLLLASIALTITFASLLGCDQAEQRRDAGPAQHGPEPRQAPPDRERGAARPRQPRRDRRRPRQRRRSSAAGVIAESASPAAQRRPRTGSRGDRRASAPEAVGVLPGLRCADAAAARANSAPAARR